MKYEERIRVLRTFPYHGSVKDYENYRDKKHKYKEKSSSKIKTSSIILSTCKGYGHIYHQYPNEILISEKYVKDYYKELKMREKISLREKAEKEKETREKE